MAKLLKEKDCSERISISKIYETIKARDFLQELWWDLISDIPKKPTYQRIKEMVKTLINDTMNEFSVEPTTEAERVKRRTMLTEISIMTYTVDTVISEVLFKKLQNEFPRLIEKMIQDLKKESKITESFILGSTQNILSAASEKLNDNNVEGPPKIINVVSLKEKSPKKTINSDEDTNNLTTRKRGRPRKQNPESKTVPVADQNHSLVPRRKRGRPCLDRNKTTANMHATKKSSSTLSPSSSKDQQNQVSLNDSRLENDEDMDRESVVESDTSIGKFSLDAVSSVHTSELSSFEDAISICSGDEEDRSTRLVPLKDANEMYVKGKLSEIYKFGKKAERFKTPVKSDQSAIQNDSPSNEMYVKGKLSEIYKFGKKAERLKTPVKSDQSAIQNDSPFTDSSVSRKLLPQRIRKPNSKYNPETMYCEMKDYSTPLSSTSPSKTTTSFKSPQKQKKRRTSFNNEKSQTNSSPEKQSRS